MIYLAEKYNRTDLLPAEPSRRAEVLSWVMWQMGSAPFLGGGFGHFYAYAPYKMEYPINRYAMEVKRQLDVLDRNLATRTYVAGESYTLADIAIWPWYATPGPRRVVGWMQLPISPISVCERRIRKLLTPFLRLRYGALVLGRLYSAAEFLDVASYTHVVRWAKMIEETRPAVRRGRMVNRGSSDSDPLYKNLPNLPERHSRADWTKAASSTKWI
eukprot:scaffold154602_cov31-Tisochrysis_lutea.AAC.1